MTDEEPVEADPTSVEPSQDVEERADDDLGFDLQHAPTDDDNTVLPVSAPADVTPSLTFTAVDATATTALPRVLPEPQPAAPAVAVLPPPQTEQVSCPECGRVATVTLTRRESVDFCANCDYPLFWTPSKILVDRSGLSDDSLRRLPGTVGRVAIASFPCPHCAEPNQVSAVDCIRCGRPLRPVHFVPPAPVYAPPPPAPEPEPEPRGVPWWVWAIIAMTVAVAVVLIVLAANGVFN